MESTIQQPNQPDRFLPPPKPDDHGQAQELVRYWRAINRHRLGIIFLVVAIGVLAAMYAFSLPATYRGTATVVLDPARKKGPVSTEDLVDSMTAAPRDYYLTQIEIMKSRDYVERLVRVLGLAKHPEYDPRQMPVKKGWLASVRERFVPAATEVTPPDAVASAVSDEQILDGVISAVQGGLSFAPVRNTNLVKISFDARDPTLVERVPNALAMVYIVEDLESRAGSTRESMSFLTVQAEKLKNQLAESERELQQYRESQKIVMARGLTVTEATRRVEIVTSALDEARKKRADAELLYQQVSAAIRAQSAAALETLPFFQRDPQIQKLRDAETEAERRAADASKRYGPEHPRIISSQSDLKLARDALRRQINLMAETVGKEFETAKANEAAATQVHARAVTEAQVFNRAEFPLGRLERNVGIQPASV